MPLTVSRRARGATGARRHRGAGPAVRSAGRGAARGTRRGPRAFAGASATGRARSVVPSRPRAARTECARARRGSRSNTWRSTGVDQAVDVVLGDDRVGLGQHHLDVGQQAGEERPSRGHALDLGSVALGPGRGEAGSDPEPTGDVLAGLGPAEDPGNGPEVVQSRRWLRADRRAGREPMLSSPSWSTGVALRK